MRLHTLVATQATDLMQGWGSMLSALFSAVALVIVIVIFRQERRERREERARTDMQQANLIQIRVRLGRTPEDSLDFGSVLGEAINRSSAPISDVTMVVRDKYQPDVRTTEYVSEIIPDRSMVVQFGLPRAVNYQGNIEPGEITEMMITMDYFATIFFTDAAGLRWERSTRRPPTRYTDPAPASRRPRNK